MSKNAGGISFSSMHIVSAQSESICCLSAILIVLAHNFLKILLKRITAHARALLATFRKDSGKICCIKMW